MARPSFRRRKFFIKKEIQGKFIAIYMVGVIAMAGMTTLILNSRLHKVVEEQLYTSHVKIHRTGELFLTPLIQTNLYAILGISLLILIFSVVIFKRLNRHFAKMDQAFNAMAAGNYLSYDPPASHFEEINAMIDLVRKAQDHYQERTSELTLITKEIETAIKDGFTPEQGESLHERLTVGIGQIQLPDVT